MKRHLTLLLLFFLSLQWSLPSLAHAENSESHAPSESTDTSGLIPSQQDLEFTKRSNSLGHLFFKEIPRDLGLSMKTAFWGWGALYFALGSGVTGGLYFVDDDVLNGWEKNTLFGATGNEVLGWTFSPYVLAPTSLALWIAGAHTQHPKLALTGRALTESLALSLGITAITKFAFRRERPNDEGNFSFPSAHTTAAFSTAAVLTTFYGWKGALPGYSMAMIVSLNRLDSQAHFLSDVVMGAVIGTVVGLGTAKFLRKEHPNLFLSPQVTHEQAGLQIHYLF